MSPLPRCANGSVDEDELAALHRKTRTKVVLSLGVLVCFVGVLFAVLQSSDSWRQPHRPLLSFHPPSLEVKAATQDLGYCGLMEDNMDYAAYNLRRVHNVTSPRRCCSKCQENPECRAWTWGKKRNVPGLSDVCFLKGLSPGEVVKKMSNEDTTSGLPFRTAEPGKVSLFCFSPVLAGDDASQLLVFQHRQGAGIFSCEEHAIYSTRPLQMAPGVPCTIVDAKDSCGTGDDSVPCVDSSAFTEVWKKVVEEGRFRFHQWAVKVQPNAVFIAHRLRTVLANVREPHAGMYLNNCEGALRTPVTILSRIAAQVYALGYTQCMTGEDDVVDGSVAKGRDNGENFVHQCLTQVLKVAHITDSSLLSDPGCQSNDMTCTSNYVAFYPYGRVEDYGDCLSQAGWVSPRVAPDVLNTTSTTSPAGSQTADSPAKED